MASIVVGDRVLVTANVSLLGQRLMMTFMYGVSTLTGSPEQITFFNNMHTALNGAGKLFPRLLFCLPQNATITSIWYQVTAPVRYAKFNKPYVDGAGLMDQDATTANVAAVITRRGDVANRHNVSSLHIPIATTSAVVAAGLVTGDLPGVLDDLAAQVKAEIATIGTVSTMTPVINNGPGSANYTPIKDAFRQDTVRVMRRRTVGLGI